MSRARRFVASGLAVALFAIASPSSARPTGYQSFNVAGRGGATWQGYSPTWIVAVKAWWRADKGTTIATGVSAWADQVGSNNLTQATGSKQPTLTAANASYGSASTLGLASASTQLLSNATLMNVAQPYTVCVVGESTSGATAQALITGDNNNGMGIFWNNPDWMLRNTSNIISSNVTRSKQVFCGVQVGSASTALYVNSSVTAAITGNNGTAAFGASGGGTAIGAFANGTDPLNGVVAEALVASGSLDVSGRWRFFTYASNRYAGSWQ